MVNWRILAKYGPIPLFFIGLLATLSESSPIDRTVDSACLFGFSAGAGILIALLLAKKLTRLAFCNEPLGARASYVLILSVGVATTFVYFSSILNRAYAPEAFVSKTFDLVSKGHYVRGNKPYIRVAMSNGVKRFDVTPSVWSSVSNQVCLDVAPGNLGFDRVIRIQGCDR